MCILVFWVSVVHCSRRARCMSEHSVKFHRIPSSRDALELRYQERIRYRMHESICIDSYGGSCVVQWLVYRRAIVRTQGLDKL